MKISMVTAGLPNPTSGGGALTAWTIACSVRAAGHDVQIVALENFHDSASRRTREDMLASLRDAGLAVSVVDARRAADSATAAARRPSHWGKVTGLLGSRRAALDRLEWFFPLSAASGEVTHRLEEYAPDWIFVYHFDALAAAFRNGVAPTMAGVGDPVHLPEYFRCRLAARACPVPERARIWLQFQRRAFWQRRLMVAMLDSCAASGAFAAHHAAWLRRQGAAHCAYLRTPVPDAAGGTWAARRAAAGRPAKPKVLLIGHMRGIATLSGLEFFARDVLPRLERQFGNDAFEVHLVGGFEPPAELKALLTRPNVLFRGHIEPADDEFLTAAAVVVPTPIPLGIRVRIITAFSFGCCIVTHRANVEGIPELRNEVNALVTGDGPAMVAALARCLADRELAARLGREARATYERAFSPATAGAAIVRELERLGPRPAGRLSENR
jgi:hypothetical protein